jgi:hypothetical protein
MTLVATACETFAATFHSVTPAKERRTTTPTARVNPIPTINEPPMTNLDGLNDPESKYAMMTLSIVQPTAKLDATVHSA